MSFSPPKEDKETLKRRAVLLEEFEASDSRDYPAWTFLISDVVKAYGICNYLDYRTDESISVNNDRKRHFLFNQQDAGATYTAKTKEVTDDSDLKSLERQLEVLKAKIHEYVFQKMSEMDLPDGLTLERITEVLLAKKETKSQNKKAKETYTQVVLAMDQVLMRIGIDLSKYAYACLSYNMRTYKAPTLDAKVVDSVYEELYTRFVTTQTSYNQLKVSKEKQIAEAKEHLALLIEKNFQVDQTGKYFKRWSSLSQDKQRERIRSYCDWYMREQNHPPAKAEEMYEWILDKLDGKELKSSDITFSTKYGYITKINILYDQQSQSFEKQKKAPRVLKKRKGPKRTLLEALEDKKVPNAQLLVERVNRLLLHEMCSHTKLIELDKDVVIGHVLKHLGIPEQLKTVVTDHLHVAYEDVLGVILSNAMTAS